MRVIDILQLTLEAWELVGNQSGLGIGNLTLDINPQFGSIMLDPEQIEVESQWGDDFLFQLSMAGVDVVTHDDGIVGSKGRNS